MIPGVIDPIYLSAVKRGVRTFVAAFLGVYGAPALIGALSGSQPIDTNVLRSAAVAGLVAVVAMLWRAFIDPLPVNTLSDANRVTKA